MSDVAIRAEGLSKQYRIGGLRAPYKTIRETMINAAATPLRRARAVLRGESALEAKDRIWALKDVSFEVNHGEVLGIIGRNGAGKTTLLKVLSRITKPTEGYAEVRGRVGSLLEVGTGFHPELTGRENVYLNGAILGMRRHEIERRFDEIVAFAEIEKFIDTPVKFYSSGMYVRLAFAVAAHLEPEVLLVDEVLAVGDAAFQKKCLGKMEAVASEGRTVLFVSHNMGAIRALCRRGVLLDDGHIVADDSASFVIDEYLRAATAEAPMCSEVLWDTASAPGKDGFRLTRVTLGTGEADRRSYVSAQTPIDVRIHYSLLEPLAGMRVVLQLETASGEIAFTSTDQVERGGGRAEPGRYVSVCRIPGSLLNIGDYWLKVWAGVPGVKYLMEPAEVLRFSVVGIPEHGSAYTAARTWPGVVCPKLDWTVIKDDV